MIIVIFTPIKYITKKDNIFGFNLLPERLAVIFFIFLFTAYILSRSTNSSKLQLQGVKLLSYYFLYLACSLCGTYLIFILYGGVDGYAEIGNDSFGAIFRSQYVWPLTQFLSFSISSFLVVIIISTLPRSMFPSIVRAMYYTIICLVCYGVLQILIDGIFGITLNQYGGGRTSLQYVDFLGLRVVRIFSLGGEPKMYGTYLSGSFFFILFYKKFGVSKILLLSTLAVSIFLTFSTSAYLALLASLIFISFLIKRIIYIFLGATITLVVAIYFQDVIGYVLLQKIGPILSLSGFDNVGEYSSADTVRAFKRWLDGSAVAYSLSIYENPIAMLFGYGYGNIMYGIQDVANNVFQVNFVGMKHDYSRVLFFTILVETGVIGLLFYISVHYKLYIACLRNYHYFRNNNYLKKELNTLFALTMGMMAHMTSSLLEVHFYSFVYMAILMLGLKHINGFSMKSVSH